MMIWGDRAYGQAAHNFAMSLKRHSPDIPIHILSQRDTLTGVPLDFFDHVETHYHHIEDAGLFKAQVYDRLPFEHTLYLDVDALCVAPIEPLFDRLIAEDKPYRCFVHTHYDKNGPEEFPLMVWANKSVIWNHYGFDDERLPATQSSLQYIRKCDFSKDLFTRLQRNFINPIPLEKLRYAWGGGQPDELYLNVTLAQLNYDPSLDGALYFGNELTIKSPSKIGEQYPILSMFGTVNNIHRLYTKFYDNELKAMSREMGHRYFFKWNNIAGRKHANKRLKRGREQRVAFNGRTLHETPFTKIKSKQKVVLFTSLYDSGNLIRNNELNHCFDRNIENTEISRIINLGPVKREHPKVMNIACERPTYNDYFKAIDKCCMDGEIAIVSNSDIYFDDTINWVKQIRMNGVMLALSRWNLNNNGVMTHFAIAGSQDVWIIKVERDKPYYQNLLKVGNYNLGLPGCDHMIAKDGHDCGYKVLNPSKDIRSIHYHNSNYRTYGDPDRVSGYYPVHVCPLPEKLPTAIIKQPGRVGDIIRCLDIAKHYSEDFIVFWECPKQYHPLFDYVDYCTPVTSGTADKIIDISFGINTQSPTQREWQKVQKHENFISLKYRLAGVPFQNKLTYNRNHIRENELYDKIAKGKGRYALVHDVSDYGTPPKIETDLEIIRFSPVEDYTIFDWRKVIEKATEIHCMDSSLCNFVNMICSNDDGIIKKYYRTDRIFVYGVELTLSIHWDIITTPEHKLEPEIFEQCV